ncbi:glycosyltransferase family 2 protein [Roseiconus nitratireducens]|uniref:Glycosyltransferase family 2 protein n=1 Tax=Roseiconus nitratireducens TaxID=2605748 RepID=A0A5M6DEZ2_9BACT|nr:glycosyltransferase family 2 protein [Roseiconus nitratireducens]KAA5546131.1 glycosyltransferase family 2 protein [Roseiconus nitratireducens]
MIDLPVPRVSVILPIYNCERYIEEAIDSVLSQSFDDFELLAFDDGSSDGTLDLLRSLEKRDDRIRVFTRENRGFAATLNELIEHSRGEYLARMDGDDVCLPDRFQLQVDYLDQHPECGCVGGWVVFTDNFGRPLIQFKLPAGDAEIQQQLLDGEYPLAHPACMFRRSVFDKVHAYDADFLWGEDADLWLRMGEHFSLANVQEPVLRYRNHPKSGSQENHDIQQGNMLRARQNAAKRRGIQLSADGMRVRPQSTRTNNLAKFGWWALNSGDRKVACEYAFRRLIDSPGSGDSWRLLASVCRSFVKPAK